MTGQTAGDARVLGPNDGKSFWQPVPANGFVRNLLNNKVVRADNRLSVGTQTVAAGCFIREHTHADNEEVIFIVRGKGIARVDGVDHPIEEGSCLFVGKNRKHQFIADKNQDLTFLWMLMPGGLDDFFEQIGRPRTPGEPAPQPFPRPENVAEIERRTVFGWADDTYNNKK